MEGIAERFQVISERVESTNNEHNQLIKLGGDSVWRPTDAAMPREYETGIQS